MQGAQFVKYHPTPLAVFSGRNLSRERGVSILRSHGIDSRLARMPGNEAKKMSPISSEAVEQTLPMKRLRQIISLGALLFVLAHLFWPVLKIDSITVCLIVIAILPWISPLVKSLELPGGWKLEFAEISKHIIEENVPSSKREKLTRHQVVSSQTWDRGYYKCTGQVFSDTSIGESRCGSARSRWVSGSRGWSEGGWRCRS